jgi:hypothetical protein
MPTRLADGLGLGSTLFPEYPGKYAAYVVPPHPFFKWISATIYFEGILRSYYISVNLIISLSPSLYKRGIEGEISLVIARRSLRPTWQSYSQRLLPPKQVRCRNDKFIFFNITISSVHNISSDGFLALTLVVIIPSEPRIAGSGSHCVII